MYAMNREKKYPLDSKKQVSAAVGLFGMHCSKYPVSRRRSAARLIMKAARNHGVEVDPRSSVARYARL